MGGGGRGGRLTTYIHRTLKTTKKFQTPIPFFYKFFREVTTQKYFYGHKQHFEKYI
jgi:hypothetical protein